MEYPKCVEYVHENLGIDLVGHEHGLSPEQIRMTVDRFPYRGILLSTGNNHLIKAGVICSSLLHSDKITGSIERYESWEPIEASKSSSLIFGILAPYLYLSSISGTMVCFIYPYTSSSTTTPGDWPQQPIQLTVSKLNWRSRLV